MANAKKMPSGTWRIIVYVGTDATGKKKYKSFTGTDKRKVEREAAEYIDSHRIAIDKGSVGYCMDAYIDSRTPVLSPSTIRGYKNIKHQFETQYSEFCKLPVGNLDENSVQDLINDMTEFASPKTIRNRYGFLTAVIRSNGYIPPHVILPERVRPNLRIPDTNDVKKLLDEAKGTELEIPIMLAAFAPMRRGEIVALKMEDIVGNTIHVRRAVVEDTDGNLIEKAPKTYDSDRLIPMPEFVIKKIREKGYIVDIAKPRILTMRFERLARKCGLDGVRFHDLRHFCASWLHAQGIPEEYILQRGGWATGNVMKTVYRHALASETDRICKGLVSSITENFYAEETEKA